MFASTAFDVTLHEHEHILCDAVVAVAVAADSVCLCMYSC